MQLVAHDPICSHANYYDFSTLFELDIEMSENQGIDGGKRVYAFANVTQGNFDAYANYTRNPLSSAALCTHTQSTHTHTNSYIKNSIAMKTPFDSMSTYFCMSNANTHGHQHTTYADRCRERMVLISS